ncbi:MAG TPA: hypothetical protein VGY94_14290, partial [Acidobacteriaceae bacterium]|nr:hypothetical protein [Acidobacteriaceae bacterium]
LCPAALTLYALYASRTETVAGMSALKFALIIAVMGLPLYLVAKLSRRDRLGETDHERIE